MAKVEEVTTEKWAGDTKVTDVCNINATMKHEADITIAERGDIIVDTRLVAGDIIVMVGLDIEKEKGLMFELLKAKIKGLESELLVVRQDCIKLWTKNTELEKKIKIVKCGQITMPEFSDDLPLLNEKIDTMEMAFLMGWEMAILECGEILSKP